MWFFKRSTKYFHSVIQDKKKVDYCVGILLYTSVKKQNKIHTSFLKNHIIFNLFNFAFPLLKLAY